MPIPLLGLALASAVGAGTGAGINAIASNNQDQGSSGPPDLLEPRSILGFFLSMIQAAQQNRLNRRYRADVDRQFGTLRNIAQSTGPNTISVYDRLAMPQLRALNRMLQTLPGRLESEREDFLGDLGERGEQAQRGYGLGMEDFLAGLAGEEAGIIGEHENRYRFAEEKLKGYGEQQKADIDKGYANKEAAITQDLISRGLSPTSVSAVAKTLNETERSGEQRRLGEDLTRSQVDILGGILGDKALARERLASQRAGYRFGGMNTSFANNARLNDLYASFDAAMRGDTNAARERLMGNVANWHGQNALNKSGLYNQGQQTLLNTIAGMNFIPPQVPNYSAMLGTASAGSPQAPSAGGYFLAGAAPGIGNAAGAGFLDWMNPMQAQAPNPYAYSPYVNQTPMPPPVYGPSTGYDWQGWGPPSF